MQCLNDLGGGNFSIASPQPQAIGSCVYIIAQPNELPNGIMNLTPEEGLQVGGLLALVLLSGFTIRVIAQTLHAGNKENEND